jgi:hypothetical protein
MPIVPGFSGFIAPQQRQVLAMKTGVSERLPLAERAAQAAHAQQRTSATPDPRNPESRFQQSCFLPKRHAGHTSYGEASSAFVRSASDVPIRANERTFMPGVDESAAKNVAFTATTTNKESTVSYCQPENSAFFSKVRVLERQDDDARHSLEDPKTRSGAALNLRCSAIQKKREHDPTLAPEPLKFRPVERARPSETAVGPVPRRSASVQPTGAAASFSGSGYGKAMFMASGSTQSLDFPDPRNVATSATATFAANQGATLLAADRAMVTTATSRDLMAGTAKASADVCSGYMGHVPANPTNVARVRGSGDNLRAHAKSFATVTAPTFNSTTSLLRAKIASAQQAAEAMTGKPPTPRTASGYFQQAAAISKDERAMNRVEVGRKNAVRGFFTRGLGEQDDLVADQFCLRFRPLEGAMRHGPPCTQGWISDTELRRSPRL